jgi:hypothetical protein
VETTADLGAGRNEVPALQHHTLIFFYVGKLFGLLFRRHR